MVVFLKSNRGIQPHTWTRAATPLDSAKLLATITSGFFHHLGSGYRLIIFIALNPMFIQLIYGYNRYILSFFPTQFSLSIFQGPHPRIECRTILDQLVATKYLLRARCQSSPSVHDSLVVISVQIFKYSILQYLDICRGLASC